MGGEGGVLPTAKQRAARPIKELWIEDRVAWSRELKQHCDKFSDDVRDALETQRGRIVRNRECGVEQEWEGSRRRREAIVDLVLRTKAKRQGGSEMFF